MKFNIGDLVYPISKNVGIRSYENIRNYMTTNNVSVLKIVDKGHDPGTFVACQVSGWRLLSERWVFKDSDLVLLGEKEQQKAEV